MTPVDLQTLHAGLAHVRASPRERGKVEFVVRRPVQGKREICTEAVLDVRDGLLGDRWKRSDEAGAQLTLMNARAAALIGGSPDLGALAGDQLFVDLDLSYENLPPGTRLEVGSAVIEITELPHRGCGKFVTRFGVDAAKLVNSEIGRELNLRGINARVVSGGVVRPGGAIAKARLQKPKVAAPTRSADATKFPG